RVGDIISGLRRFKPDVVHFSAHGSPLDRIVLLDKNDRPQEISREILDELFHVMRENIRLVVLNACYSRTQAKSIAKHIDCVVGVDNTLADDNAITFSEQFYEAIVAGRSVKEAVQEARIVLTD